MKLSKVLNLNKCCMISVVGAGGKSTLMYTLADELRYDNKCLVTTTTKIFVPEREQFDFIGTGNESFNKFKLSLEKGIYVLGSSINEENKLVGIQSEELEGQLTHFDYVLIEADGSKRKPIKGWNDSEPVICKDTKITIGVLSIESLGKKINEENVHRVKEFENITRSRKNEIITEEHILSLIFHPKGLFKNSIGENILFINKIENAKQLSLAKSLLLKIKLENNKNLLIDRIVMGSLNNKYYELV